MLILLISLFIGGSVKAQDVIRQRPCQDSTISREADSLKNVLKQKGFIVVKEASMRMESEYEMPVIVPLNEGTMYAFAFIGDLNSKLYELRMYDYNEKQVVYEKHYGDGMESNILSYVYVPKFTEYHIIKPVQVSKVKKKKDLCGYIMMFKKVQ